MENQYNQLMTIENMEDEDDSEIEDEEDCNDSDCKEGNKNIVAMGYNEFTTKEMWSTKAMILVMTRIVK